MARPNASERAAMQQGAGFTGLAAFQRKLARFDAGLLPAVLDLAHESIVNGSPITGAPGQPVEEGDLRDSWVKEQTSPTTGSVLSDSEYALQNETGVKAGGGVFVQRSTSGGRFSVALTRRNFQSLVEHAARAAMAEAGGGGR